MIKNTLITLSLILGLDLLGFILWFLSGQLPQDTIYIGAITKTLLSLII